MLSVCTMVMATALTGVGQVEVGQVELVEFTADWCGACQQMQPAITRLQADGFAIRQLDFEQHREMAERAGVRALPTLILLVDGQEVERLTGRQTYERLREILAQTAGGSSAPAASHVPTGVPIPAAPLAHAVALTPATSSESIVRGQSSSATLPLGSPVERAMQATVRIRIDDAQGRAFGTGTIVDLHRDEALVLTCGHIFRDSNGRGTIKCDLFVNGQPRTVPGRMISWNMRRDVGLISIKPGIAIQPVKVAGPGHRPRPGDRVFAIGCNQGNDPSLIENRVIAVNRYHGPSNLVVGGRPIDGRSGGGLFTDDGVLIGVCNAADQEEDEGLYAAVSPIHAELDSAGLGFVYRHDDTSLASAAQPAAAPLGDRSRNALRGEDSPGRPAPAPGTRPWPVRLETPLGMRAEAHDSTQRAPQNIGISQLARAAQDSEVICILRDRETPTAKSKVFVLEQPSTQFLSQLSSEISRRGPLATTGLRSDRPQHRPAPANDGGWQHARPEFRR